MSRPGGPLSPGTLPEPAPPEAGPLPRLLLIADGFASGRGTGAMAQSPQRVRKVAAEAVAAGVRWVMLRDHAAPAPDFLRAAGRLAERLRDIAPEVRLAVNTRADAARRLRAGLHVGTRGPGVAEALESARTVGVSAHAPEAVAAAHASGAAYALFSPVYRTATHPEAAPVGLGALREACGAAPVSFPVLALGGVTAARVAECRAAGAHGAAVLSAIFDAHRPARAVAQLLTALGA